MQTVMILPPTVTALGFAASGPKALADAVTTGFKPDVYHIFIDMQANVVELQERRYLVEHQIPGREGGILQDLGSACARLTLSGKWIYENKPHNDIIDMIPTLAGMNVAWNWMRVQMMRLIPRMKTPVFIASDVITSAVMIEDFKVRHVGGAPNVFEYTISMREWNPALTVLGISAGLVTSLIPSIVQENVGY